MRFLIQPPPPPPADAIPRDVERVLELGIITSSYVNPFPSILLLSVSLTLHIPFASSSSIYNPPQAPFVPVPLVPPLPPMLSFVV